MPPPLSFGTLLPTSSSAPRLTERRRASMAQAPARCPIQPSEESPWPRSGPIRNEHAAGASASSSTGKSVHHPSHCKTRLLCKLLRPRGVLCSSESGTKSGSICGSSRPHRWLLRRGCPGSHSVAYWAYGGFRNQSKSTCYAWALARVLHGRLQRARRTRFNHCRIDCRVRFAGRFRLGQLDRGHVRDCFALEASSRLE